MKKLVLILLGLSLAATRISAQCTQSGNAKLLPSIQAVKSCAINHPDLMVVTGRIVDAETHDAISDARINFDKFGDELVSAAIDNDGNYAIALNKKEIGEQVRIIFKIEGYHSYVAKSVRTSSPTVDLDLYLRRDQSRKATTADIKYTLGDDPYENALVIKF